MAQYITVTLELSGEDDEALSEAHANLRDLLALWRDQLTYASLTIAYQDQAQIAQDAQVEVDPRDDER